MQAARRAAGFDISDRIALKLDGDQKLLDAARTHQQYIAGETLAATLEYGSTNGVPPLQLDGLDLLIEVQRI